MFDVNYYANALWRKLNMLNNMNNNVKASEAINNCWLKEFKLN